MPLPRDTRSSLDRLRELLAMGEGISIDDLKMRSHWARYLVVQIAGLLEVGTREILLEYVEAHSHPSVAGYARRQLNRFQNPKMQAVRDLVAAFDKERAEMLGDLTLGEVSDSVDSVMANRHLIAHGANCGVTLAGARQYLGDAEALLTILRELFEP